MSDRERSGAAEAPDFRQAGNGDPGRQQDRERCCSRPVGGGARGGQRKELSDSGVKVAVIEPGYFKTPITNKDRIFKSMLDIWDRARPEVKQIYGEKFITSYKESIDQLEPKYTQDLSLVTNCIEHALTACHPRTRYSAGWDAKLLYLPMSYMPTFLADAIINWGSPRPGNAL
ncbi:retinol dehydrogenase 16 isoform X2 [Saimiri boliviensis]|uniref:retinol dehydrogenase 16 isoform X2 n=1 Tax=Saimiri boliviensis TaxID=27679 RepID=UPI00193EA5B3|nr:retinol dehydrogenase 16 isoform X2 [Saimiri boliviensis boliviensis]